MTVKPATPNIPKLIFGGLAAGLLINAVEYLVHRVLLIDNGRPHRALGNTWKGWKSIIPSNFLVGIIGIWIYAKFLPNYGPGYKTVLRSALTIWVVFWAIPMMALQPLDIFPNFLLFATIAVGLLDSILAVLLGAWIYRQ